jgi:hypothetical protein
MANFNQSLTFTGLTTQHINIPTTDTYNLSVKTTLPSNNTNTSSALTGPGGGTGTGTGAAPTPTSQVVTTIKQNGSTIYTSAAGTRGFELNAIVCTAGDVLDVVTSSSLASDQQLEAVKTTVAVSEGPL